MSEGRILIADDEKEILDVLEMLFVENGYEVVRARTVARLWSILLKISICTYWT